MSATKTVKATASRKSTSKAVTATDSATPAPLKKKGSGPIELPEFKRAMIVVYVIGETPLIVHAWSKKARIEMLLKQMGQTVPRYPRSPVRDFLDSIYHTADGAYGFPATALKSAMVSACTSMNREITKIAAQQAFYVQSERGLAQTAFTGIDTPIQLVRLYSPNAPRMREDATKIGIGRSKTAMLSYRAEFDPWGMRVAVQYNRLLVTRSTVAALVDTAGFAVGMGEWRQERSGINGSFRLASEAEQKMIDGWAKQPPKPPVLPDEQAFIAEALEALRVYGEAKDELETAAETMVEAVAKVEATRRRNGHARGVQ
jgi:hypothetical protein